MFKFVVTNILTIVTLFSTAQTADTFKISGQIVSAFDNAPIPDGDITFTRTKGYRCDSLGRFTIYGMTRGQHKLTFSTFGYPTSDTLVTIDNIDILNFTWTIRTTCTGNYTRIKAFDDIKKGEANLLVAGGIAPVSYSTDNNFKKKYKIGYYIFGCIAPDLDECLTMYNVTIFEYLDKTFGKKWRRDVRKDVIGLKPK